MSSGRTDQYGLSTAHVATLYGYAAPGTDVFTLRARAKDSPRRIGQFAGHPALQGTFTPGSTVGLDAALVSLASEVAGNEFAIDGHLQKIDEIKSLAPRAAIPKPAVMIVRSSQQLQMAEIVATHVALPFLTRDDDLVFYSGLDELRKLQPSTYTVPKDVHHVVKTGTVLTRPGDSGSIVLGVDEQSFGKDRRFSACGMIVGGNGEGNNNGLAYSIPLALIQKALVFDDLAE